MPVATRRVPRGETPLGAFPSASFIDGRARRSSTLGVCSEPFEPAVSLNTGGTDPREFAKVVRDPVHDYVGIPGELLPIVDHPFVQRLRRISQTAMSSVVYPSMNGRRFEHSLGAMHLAIDGWSRAWRNTSASTRATFRESINPDIVVPDENDMTIGATHIRQILDAGTGDEEFATAIGIAVGAAALLHDVGHSPFSHTLEEFYKTYLPWIISGCDKSTQSAISRVMSENVGRDFHEQIGLVLLARLESEVKNEIPWQVVSRILVSESATGTWSGCLHDFISGEVDVDRFDYLIRDTHYSGTEFGAFDKERLLQSLELHLLKEIDSDQDPEFTEVVGRSERWVIGFGVRATSALETFVTNRYQYYRWVAFHFHTVAANRMLKLCVFYLMQIYRYTDSKGRIQPSAPPGAFLNYFAGGQPYSRIRNRDLARADDGTIYEWIKSGINDFRQTGPADIEQARFRFVSLADATLHRTPNWIPIWKTDGSYREFCESQYERLKNIVTAVHRRCEESASARAGSALAISRLRVLKEMIDAFSVSRFEEGQKIPHGSVPFSASGPVPLMNAFAKTIIGTQTEFGSVRFLRELSAAEYFATIAGVVEGHERGFWVFAYDAIEPWRAGDAAAQVFRGDKHVPLSEESGHMLHRLETVESERAQFHCYFVSPGRDDIRGSPDAAAIVARFRARFAQFAYAILDNKFCQS